MALRCEEIAKAFSGGALGHAYLSVGAVDDGLQNITETLEHLVGVPSRKNQDFLVLRYEQFTIEEARGLVRNIFQRPVQEGRRFFCVGADVVTMEAQNALLKITEEPPLYAHLFFCVPTQGSFVPTLRSRFSLLASTSSDSLSPAGSFVGETFLTDTITARKKRIESLTKKNDRQGALSLLRLCELSLRDNFFDVQDPNAQVALREVLFVQTHLLSQRGSLKMLLEHAAVAVPRLDRL